MLVAWSHGQLGKSTGMRQKHIPGGGGGDAGKVPAPPGQVVSLTSYCYRVLAFAAPTRVLLRHAACPALLCRPMQAGPHAQVQGQVGGL